MRSRRRAERGREIQKAEKEKEERKRVRQRGRDCILNGRSLKHATFTR